MLLQALKIDKDLHNVRRFSTVLKINQRCNLLTLSPSHIPRACAGKHKKTKRSEQRRTIMDERETAYYLSEHVVTLILSSMDYQRDVGTCSLVCKMWSRVAKVCEKRKKIREEEGERERSKGEERGRGEGSAKREWIN
jgi:hypothetical protein